MQDLRKPDYKQIILRVVADFGERRRPLPAPTFAPAGSTEKVEVLVQRQRRRQELFHPLDDGQGLSKRVERDRNGAVEYLGAVADGWEDEPEPTTTIESIVEEAKAGTLWQMVLAAQARQRGLKLVA